MLVRRTFTFIVLAAITLFPLAASAQTGTISGVVRDTTGGVLPGVTVEAASPALIEQVRTAVTDGQGIYRIVDLRLGGYTVTFTLPGFSTLIREGIDLPAGVTVTVNADLSVGELEETITVTGASPLVDTQNVTQVRPITRSSMDNLPTGRQFGNYVVTIPGVFTNRQDVGGAGITQATTNMMGIHGSNAYEAPMLIDGMRYANIFGAGGGASGPYLINNAMIEELSVSTAAGTAEQEVSGVVANIIMKQGANTFSGSFFGTMGGEALQSDNLDDALVARGARSPTVVSKTWDVSGAIGGPIVQDRLWFYGASRYYGIREEPTGAVFSKDPASPLFEPGETATYDAWNRNENIRLTWQSALSSKLSLYADNLQRCLCKSGLSATTAYEATSNFIDPSNKLFQATWNWAISNALLLEVGETYKPDMWGFMKQADIPADRLQIRDVGIGITYGNYRSTNRGQYSKQYNGKAVMTYVTGAQSLKVGAQWFHGDRLGYADGGESALTLRNGVPISVTMNTNPVRQRESLDMNLGIYAQEQLTLDRATLNLGVRFDYLKASVIEQFVAAGPFVPERRFDPINDVPNWKDISPRLGVSYDLFGDARTALKASLGKYMSTYAAGIAERVNPHRAPAGTATTRAWDDSVGPGAGNFIPDCNLANFAANGECAAIDNQNFGQTEVPIRYDPDVITGWGKRDYNWEAMAGVQHEFYPGMSVEVSYHRRWFGNLRVYANEAVTPADFDEFSITTPVDSRLPGGGGQVIGGLFDIRPELFGVSDTVIQHASNFGDISQVFNGVDVVLNLRFENGALLSGGTSTGRMRVNLCDALIGNPQITGYAPYIAPWGSIRENPAEYSRTEAFCDISPPYLTQVKLSGVYPLPWDIQTSAIFQSIRYPQEFSTRPGGILARSSIPLAQIQPSLGRPLSGGRSTAGVQLVPAGTLYSTRIYQLDVRLARNFRMGDTQIQPQFDLYNLFNDNTVLTENHTYGSRWGQPTSILQGRTLKFAVQVDF